MFVGFLSCSCSLLDCLMQPSLHTLQSLQFRLFHFVDALPNCATPTPLAQVGQELDCTDATETGEITTILAQGSPAKGITRATSAL